MAETIGEAEIRITADSKGFGDGLKRGIGAGVAAGGAIAAVAVTKFAKDSVAAFSEAEQATLRLEDAFTKFPSLAGANIEEFKKLNTEMQKKTRFDDEAAASGQAVLAQFGLTGQQLKDLTPLVADYAAKTGTDLPTAAEQVGKAMLGQGRALKSVGIDFQDAGSVAGNFDQVMGGLRAQVGGFAEKEGKTAAGQLEILRNQFGEIQESAGAALLPVLQKLAPVFLNLLNAVAPLMSQLAGAIGSALTPLIPAFAAIIQALLPIIPPLTAVATIVAEVLAQALLAAVPLIEMLAGMFVQVFKALEPFLPQIVELAGQLFGALMPAVMAIFEAFKPLLPIFLQLITAMLPPMVQLLGLIAPILVAITPLIELLARLLAGALGKALEFILPLIIGWSQVLEKIIGWITKVIQGIGEFAKALGKIKLPDWLTPGSPSPIENTLKNISQLAKGLPNFGGIGAVGGLSPVAAGAGGGTIVVPLYIDGREVARATASPMRDELNRMGRNTPIFGGRG